MKIDVGEVLKADAAIRAKIENGNDWQSFLHISAVEIAGSIAKWFGAGIVAAGMGSKLVTDDAVKSGDWAAIEASVRSAVDAVAAFRASKKG